MKNPYYKKLKTIIIGENIEIANYLKNKYISEYENNLKEYVIDYFYEAKILNRILDKCEHCKSEVKYILCNIDDIEKNIINIIGLCNFHYIDKNLYEFTFNDGYYWNNSSWKERYTEVNKWINENYKYHLLNGI